jgi:predicted TPR repeat methyltransferase
MHRPAWNPKTLVAPVENGYAAYVPSSDKVHQLNPIAALISELCDGTRTVGQIHELLDPVLPEGSAGEIDRWIAEAVKEGLLTLDGEAQGGPRELSADELEELARKLRKGGKREAAYICAQRAAEQDPSDSDKWLYLAETAHMLGRRDDARVAYERYLGLEPDDLEVQHIMISLRDEAPPARMSNECVQYIYRYFAPTYDQKLCQKLSYEGPQRLQTMVDSLLGDRRELSVLDVGCGSGLAGLRFKGRAARLLGIDISPEMIELARAREIYDQLEVAEIIEWFSRDPETYDLIVACECLEYFGHLSQVVNPAAQRLRPGGTLAFTVEKGRYPFALTDSGRYQHHPQHIREVARSVGLKLATLQEHFLRKEYGIKMTGLFAILRKTA